MATLRGQAVDRPAVSFYEIGGWDILSQCDNDDEFNVYNHPSWRPLAELAASETDIIRMGGGGWLDSPDDPASDDPAAPGHVTYDTWREGRRRFTRTTLNCGRCKLTSTTRRDADTMTTWTTEHLLKGVDELKAYLDLPVAPWPTRPDVAAFEAAEAALGEAGIVMIDCGDPICEAASLFSMADYTVVAMTEQELFHRLLQRIAERAHTQTEAIARDLPGRLWRICGSEYASEPYLPPRLYGEYVARYTGPMVQAIQRHGGFARIHSHGKLRGIMPHIAAMAPAAMDPCEPPPQGDMELAKLRSDYGRDMVLLGNIESSDIENLPAAAFEKKVVKALTEGTSGQGRGFVLMPSSCPYGRVITPETLANYETMVRLATTWGG